MSTYAFDSNAWYGILFQDKPDATSGHAMDVANDGLRNNFGAPVFGPMSAFNVSRQQWQFYPTSDTGVFMIRSNGIGANMYLGTYGSNPVLKYISDYPNDESMLWTVQSWGDEWYSMTNKANGTGWKMGVSISGNYGMYMTNTETASDETRFNFTEVGALAVWNYGFKTIQTPGSLITANAPQSISQSTVTTVVSSSPAQQTNTPASMASPIGATTAATTAACSVTDGLSPGASAAIAAAVTFVLCTLFFTLSWFFLRRREQAQPAAQASEKQMPTVWSSERPLPPTPSETSELNGMEKKYTHELYGSDYHKELAAYP